MTGMSISQRLFGRAMRTKLVSLAAKERSPVAPARDVELEYNKLVSPCVVNYKPGDLVFVTKQKT